MSDKQYEKKAIILSEMIDSSTLQIFSEWHFSPRGSNGYWFKQRNDFTRYGIIYRPGKESEIKVIYNSNAFISDFHLNLKTYLPAKSLTLKKIDKNISIIYVDHKKIFGNENDYVDSAGILTDLDPFEKFEYMNDLKNKLGIFALHGCEESGGLVEFYLSPQHVLTWIKDPLRLSSNWISILKTGKYIKANWNYRKLSKPLDLG